MEATGNRQPISIVARTDHVDTLAAAYIPAAPVLSPQQALDHPHIRATGFLKNVDYPGLPNPAPVARAAVRLSQTPGEIVKKRQSVADFTGRSSCQGGGRGCRMGDCRRQLRDRS